MKSQIMFFKLTYLAYENGLNQWFEISNSKLMDLSMIQSETSFKRSRQKLIELGLIEYEKGKKGKLGKYKINLERFGKSKTEIQKETEHETNVGEKEYFKLPKLVKIYVKDYPHLGYAVVGELEIGSEILLDFFFADKNSASMSMKYIKENILK